MLPIIHKELISKTYKEKQKINNSVDNPREKEQETRTGSPPPQKKDIKMANKHMKGTQENVN